MIDPQRQKNAAQLVYVLYLASLFLGLTGLIGLIVAYIYRPRAPEWLQSHFRHQIRTFWIGFALLAVGVVLSIVLVGYLVLLFLLVWWVLRCVKGFLALDDNEAI